MTSSRFGWLRNVRRRGNLRPPGARPEAEFEALCTRCNRCIEICPYKSLKPAGIGSLSSAGTPVVVAREVPCYLCMLCPPVCPTGALEPLRNKRDVRMGVAFVDQSACYAFRGILCRTCVDECPIQGEAIYQDADLFPRVTDKCVGCGVCERVCPPTPAAITIRPKAVHA